MVRGLVSLYGFDRLFRRFDEVCKQYRQGTEWVSYVSFSSGKAKHIWPARDFAAYEIVPFEFTQTRIPVGYDERLRIEYKDYMVCRHTATAHGDLVIAPETPCEEYLRKHTGKELVNMFRQT